MKINLRRKYQEEIQIIRHTILYSRHKYQYIVFYLSISIYAILSQCA